MLFTRCPSCETTFRITADALSKAEGRVRCGRCASVFNAHAELREQRAAGSGTSPEADSRAAAGSGADAAAGPSGNLEEAATDSAAAAGADTDGSFEDLTVAQVIRQIASGAVDDDGAAEQRADERLGEGQVDKVLDQAPTDGLRPWQLLPELEPRERRPRRWLYASLAAGVLLASQAVHHFRSEIAATPVVGPLLQDGYAYFGTKVTPRWNLEQYAIVDWIATAEPNVGGRGSLKITAHIQNKGPEAQPYPHVHVQLKDRWEGSIGSRYFEPAEYLPSNARAGALMAPGTTARAELEVVDPGPDAYGFELDICVEANGQSLRCSVDSTSPIL